MQQLNNISSSFVLKNKHIGVIDLFGYSMEWLVDPMCLVLISLHSRIGSEFYSENEVKQILKIRHDR